jgi:hypothetical protein
MKSWQKNVYLLKQVKFDVLKEKNKMLKSQLENVELREKALEKVTIEICKLNMNFYFPEIGRKGQTGGTVYSKSGHSREAIGHTIRQLD